MTRRRHHFTKLALMLFLLFFIFVLSHSSVHAEWTTVNPPTVSDSWYLNAVHFTSADEGWAVGQDNTNSRGALLHYQSGVWTSVTPPTVSDSWYLNAVHFTSADEGWAVGEDNTNSRGALLHYQSGVWTSVPPPANFMSWYLYAVHFASPNEGWAVGYRQILLRYQSGTWTIAPPPTVSESESWYLDGIHFTSADEGWAVGVDFLNYRGVLLHYQSGTWTSVSPPTVSDNWYLHAVHFTSVGEGWAVGTDDIRGTLLHYQSGVWTSVLPPTVSDDWFLSGVHFTSANEGWAVGKDSSNRRGVLLRYDGSQQSQIEGTIGTEITITGSGFGTKKGKVLIGGVATKIAKDGWTDTIITATLTKVLTAGEAYDVTILIQPYETTAPTTLSGAFTFMAPELDPLLTELGPPGTEITVTGRFFSTKKGKVYLEDLSTGKKRNCKVTYWYMDKTTGESELRFLVPKSTKVFLPGAYPLKVSNKVGIAETTFTLE